MSHASSHTCSVKPSISLRPRAVKINGVTIPREEIARETQNHPAAKPVDAWKAAARALAVRELLIQEAARLGIEAKPLEDEEGRRETDSEARTRRLVELEVRTPSAGEAECRRYYEQNLHRFRSPDLYEVSHILIAKSSGETEAQSHEIAQGLLSRLEKEPAAFAELAHTYSACPSREVGGSLGQIGPGQTVVEFERALPRMEPGCVYPVETRYGHHIVRVDRRIEGRQLPFELVHPRVAAFLEERVRRTAVRQYISLLAGRASIEGIELEAATSPLLQ